MRELALNILDIAENSVKAGATLVKISIVYLAEYLTIEISDNGCGMESDFLARVSDPFTTTRMTRKVGLGIPFFKMASEMTGGEFGITSAKGVGTTTKATFNTEHIDCMPLGDMGSTMTALIVSAPHIRYVLTYDQDGNTFEVDTDEVKKELGNLPIESPEILSFLSDMINENIKTIKIGGQ